MNGKLIVIEGTDGSGKQTQSRLLVDKLNHEGYKSKMISFPRYKTPTGDIVGDCYLGKGNRIYEGSWFDDPANLDPKIASLYYAADRRAMASNIRSAINHNRLNIILDRYVESNQGHQCGKLKTKKERVELRDWIEKLEYDLLELPRPDLVIFLYMPFEISRILKKQTKEKLDAHESSDEHLKNAERSYLELSEYYKWYKIDCSKDDINPRNVEEIHEEIFQIFLDLIG